MFEYFFILGRNSALSVAEIESAFGKDITSRTLGKGFYIIETKGRLNLNELQQTLGGTIKIGEIVLKSEKEIINYLKDSSGDKKLRFGINLYGCDFKPMQIKKQLRDAGISSRLVESKEKILSSVITQKEILNKDGIELNCFKIDNTVRVGRTSTCQPFEEFSFRDWQRPAKDQASGMLPPKVAKIMINLAQSDKKEPFLDPFCGSGTILMEAALMGYNDLIGTDISDKAIADTKTNFEWLDKQGMIKVKNNFQIFQADIKDLDKNIKNDSVRIIVTEPFLGPPLKKDLRIDEIIKIKSDLEDLYVKSFEIFKKILKTSGRIVIIMPVFLQEQNIYLEILDTIKKLGFEIVNPIKHLDFDFTELTKRGGILYSRPDQRVGREIFVIEKR